MSVKTQLNVAFLATPRLRYLAQHEQKDASASADSKHWTLICLSPQSAASKSFKLLNRLLVATVPEAATHLQFNEIFKADLCWKEAMVKRALKHALLCEASVFIFFYQQILSETKWSHNCNWIFSSKVRLSGFNAGGPLKKTNSDWRGGLPQNLHLRMQVIKQLWQEETKVFFPQWQSIKASTHTSSWPGKKKKNLLLP